MLPDEHNAYAWLDSSPDHNKSDNKNENRENKQMINKMLNFLDMV